MIKAGIYAAETPVAGEIARILINHPDVHIAWLQAEAHAGRALVDIHHGMVGETDLRFVSRPRPGEADVVFVCGNRTEALDFAAADPEIRIVSIVPIEAPDVIYGLPELNRKPLVRGATRASVPTPVANIVLLSLLPLAKEGIIASDISVKLSLPQTESAEGLDRVAEIEIPVALRSLQESFGGNVGIEYEKTGCDRVLSASVSIDSDLNIGELTRLYEEYYDDHNFTFVVDRIPEPREVEGTNKCLLYLDKSDGKLTVHAAFDAPLKGAAGTAVHCMNLLFGLAERIGLALKASSL